MKNSAKRPIKRAGQPGDIRDRSDTKTRRLLEAAGHVFAEKGFDRATGKEICEKAGVNTAAVNYYFGGIEGLYTAVLGEALGRLPDHETVSAAVAGKTDPKGKLTALIELTVRALTGTAPSSWMFRVITREFLSPSSALMALRQEDFIQKTRILKGIVSELMGLPEDHPGVARGCISVMAPCVMLLVGNRELLQLAFPQLGLGPESIDAIVDHMVRYAVSGLISVGRELRKSCMQAEGNESPP